MTPEEQLEAALAEVERLRAALAEKDVKLASKDEQIKSLQDQLLWLRKKVYGHMSEKHLPIDPLQLNLFEKEHMTDEERARLAAEMAAAEQTITKTITVKEKPARRDLNTSALPVEECHVYPDGTTDESGNLKDEYEEIGTEESSRLERIPARTYIVKTIRHKVIAKSDMASKKPEDRAILVAEMPLAPVAKCMAGASVLADIVIGKFMYHLPFYRLIPTAMSRTRRFTASLALAPLLYRNISRA